MSYITKTLLNVIFQIIFNCSTPKTYTILIPHFFIIQIFTFKTLLELYTIMNLNIFIQIFTILIPND